mgnify:CR=1 FL=1
MNTETSLALNLIREHYDGTDESFKEAAFDLARYYDNNDRSQLAEYIFALIYPGATFTTFEIDYHKGQIISGNVTKHKYKIISVEPSGVYIVPIDRNQSTAYFIHHNDLVSYNIENLSDN